MRISRIEIENWFDKKWMQFSGKHLVPRWLKEITIPAFAPSRIRGERRWSRTCSNDFALVDHPNPVHPRERQPSRLNIHRKIANISSSAVFVWYSSNAEKNGAASLMVYTSKSGNVDTWFAGFRKSHEWYAQSTVGISRVLIERLLAGASSDLGGRRV